LPNVERCGSRLFVHGSFEEVTLVVEVLDRLIKERGRPKTIRCDDGPEFADRLLDQWAYLNRVKLDFSRPGKPTDNAFIEAFNARLRAECLNASWLLSMADARDRIEAWRIDYNEERPHTSLGNLTPRQFARQAQPARKVAQIPDQAWR
jgi:putative transposase